ncbi:RIP metalloprotease RseP [Wenzhouxiangella sediminis]|uniref:Zinc metalloprotease n=1 Tax=Wenzhouxiangella sediminis TaxID=1792836 RepID=A0A3E1K8C2_9GAMM|nr:RIP metalloprotease RseP [Wenzhouxiangella sediminis]RFF30313.1 RIP metalloprotease RseP [Wenzhouxiangella sediminis]
MLDILGPILWLAVALGLLVTFHEFGHFWVARRSGVRVLQFSIGFGPALWSRTGRDGTEYRVAAIPLGGYVRMLDEREAPVADDELDQAFNRKPLGQRMAIVAAGPAFNFIFAIAAFWLMFVVGVPETRPVVGETSGIAAEAGLENEDLIVRVGDADTQTWTHVLLELMPHALDGESVTVVTERPGGGRRTLELPLQRMPADFDESRALEAIGLSPWRPDLPPVVGEVSPATPADRAGLQSGDRIVSIAGEPVEGWRDVARLIPAHGLDEQDTTRELDMQVERDGRLLELALTPELRDGRAVIGIQSPPPDDATRADMERAFTVLRHGPVDAVGQAFAETGRLTAATFGMLGRMITGSASLSNLSGPITIAQMAHSSALLGFSRFLFFLGLISLSLAIINLLPIPVLDGGHLMYYLVELVKGSPVSEKTQIAGQYLGILMVVGLMSLAIFNDLLRLFS